MERGESSFGRNEFGPREGGKCQIDGSPEPSGRRRFQERGENASASPGTRPAIDLAVTPALCRRYNPWYNRPCGGSFRAGRLE
jgi:hypothetical protein